MKRTSSRLGAIAVSAALLVSLFSLTGCAHTDTQVRQQSYSDDGLLGTTQANPNLPTSPTYHNYASDVSMMNQTLRSIPGVVDSTIVLRGVNATATIRVADGTDIENAMRIKREAQDALNKNMPRYNVTVKLANNRG